MTFTTESDFEEALILALSSQKGWNSQVIKKPTEADLLKNWANILFENNRDIDRLNNTPLTEGEMQQILEQITTLRTPLKLNGFINGKTVAIKRDNPADTLHFGKEVSLKIYDRHEIAGGQSRYQIVQQPQFKSKSKILNDRRGDVLLLINGMPLIHIELKRSGVAVSQACHQIENYARSGNFTGLFSLVQVFVAMQPEETVYFANPGPDGKFNKDFFFHWADFNNEPINQWADIASKLLSIPMAHQLIGFYTVPDDTDGVLKVMRSYQYYASNAISDKVAKTDWKSKHALGGYIWHTTGSGKTMTSFKSAQLIANSQDADKVIFLMDRIELGTQSLKEYRGFSDENEDVQATENTGVLVTKLKSFDPANTLIVTSIQKMSNIKNEEEGLNTEDIELFNKKRLVFIVDEAHRSTFGDMLINIKNTFTSAIFFGFTGTPILEENQKKLNTTSTVFGDELHRYSIGDGIRDKNVLGFDPYKILTYKDRDLRKEVALEKAKTVDEAEALADPKKREIFNKFMIEVKMAGHTETTGNYVKGIEDFIPKSQYERIQHQKKVAEDIIENWLVLSQNNKFHAIFATSSINEAISYYRLIKQLRPRLKITALFDPNIDNVGHAEFKEDGLVEIIEDYNARYERDYTLASHAKFKKDIAARLAHKQPYLRVENNPEKQIDLLIVVDQMLTGFDSKWINTLYLDKMLKYENIIQAFSRTNRLFGPEKPFGTIRYYRFPHTMERNINDAIKLYSGDRPVDLFVEKLDRNLNSINYVYNEIAQLFSSAGIQNFERVPESIPERGRFAELFKELNQFLEAAKIQGFKWSQLQYEFGKGKEKREIKIDFDESTYLILALRYKELFNGVGGGMGIAEVPYEIEGHLTEIDTDKIDADYMNSRFDKYLKVLRKEGVDATELQNTLDELHKSFASLTQEEQKYANIFIHDVQSGAISIESGKTFREYITEYRYNAKNDQIKKIASLFGLDELKLRNLMDSGLNEMNINEYGRFDELKNTIDKTRAKAYFEKVEGVTIPAFRVNIKTHNLLQKFIITGGFEI
ncbi:type I restriction endonuclease subunit R [Flavobacterium sp. GN10]|uniref:Type I restriction enzyme endonuclease subunit n=1 Tax=Flavobacterium tagetis TaxID=2801336 RepID=A0ABS1KHZ5_9FLAO|nr:HsdR family type I site-specific deoxyribonuclease [Flavobacterium tagetis]MBL0737811.1 type I restriction endonuclease subunit R [Flavobacterium tagetis]